MDQILFATGLYGFSGSILLVIFHFLPEIKEVHSNGKPFFIYKNEIELNQCLKTYAFYSNLWGFRLISTGFIIMIIYSLLLNEYQNLLGNIIFVIFDITVLFIISTWGISNIVIHSITPRKGWILYYYFGLTSGFYFLLIMMNGNIDLNSSKIQFMDNIILISALISQLVFFTLFFSRWKIRTHHEKIIREKEEWKKMNFRKNVH